MRAALRCVRSAGPSILRPAWQWQHSAQATRTDKSMAKRSANHEASALLEPANQAGLLKSLAFDNFDPTWRERATQSLRRDLGAPSSSECVVGYTEI
jgi:hypothetical protein